MMKSVDQVAEGVQSVLSQAPSSEEFLLAFGKITWLITMSKRHREKPATWIEAQIAAPLVLKQAQVISKGKQPLAAITWAWASPEVAAKIDAGDASLALNEWRSGPDIRIVDCISPFVDREMIIKQFLANIETAKQKLV